MMLLPEGAVSAHITNEAVLAIIWGVAFLGAALKVILARRFETPGLVLYVILGCAVVSFTHAVIDGYAGGWRLMLEFAKSGACYLGGLVFYLDDEIPQSNALWHSSVLAGAVLHTRIVYNIVALGHGRFPLPE
jgi:hemolysin III